MLQFAQRRHIAGRCEVNARGRMRNRGASGGGTLRRVSPQFGQRPSLDVAAVASARSQCPRASQSWLMHWTVNPGKYCIIPLRDCFSSRLPTCCPEPKSSFTDELSQKILLFAGILRCRDLRCQEKSILDVVVVLRGVEKPIYPAETSFKASAQLAPAQKPLM